jgi:hypothetical protein
MEGVVGCIRVRENVFFIDFQTFFIKERGLTYVREDDIGASTWHSEGGIALGSVNDPIIGTIEFDGFLSVIVPRDRTRDCGCVLGVVQGDASWASKFEFALGKHQGSNLEAKWCAFRGGLWGCDGDNTTRAAVFKVCAAGFAEGAEGRGEADSLTGLRKATTFPVLRIHPAKKERQMRVIVRDELARINPDRIATNQSWLQRQARVTAGVVGSAASEGEASASTTAKTRGMRTRILEVDPDYKCKQYLSMTGYQYCGWVWLLGRGSNTNTGADKKMPFTSRLYFPRVCLFCCGAYASIQ